MSGTCDAPAALEARVVVIGDAGSPHPTDDRVLAAARDCVLAAGDAPSVAVFVGDNVYGGHRIDLRAARHGGPYGGYRGHPRDEAQIDAQIGLLPAGRAWFVAGNHDWYAGARGLRAQAARVGDGWLGGTGCDDLRVDVIPVGPVRIVAFDSMAAFRCGRSGRATLQTGLAAALASDGVAIVASHHPQVSVGSHGSGRIPQDRDAPRYRRYREVMSAALADSQASVLLASGHDHHLAWIAPVDGPALVQIVSGAGSEDVRLDREGLPRRPLEAPVAEERGFIVLDARPGAVDLRVVRIGDAGIEPRFTLHIP